MQILSQIMKVSSYQTLLQKIISACPGLMACWAFLRNEVQAAEGSLLWSLQVLNIRALWASVRQQFTSQWCFYILFYFILFSPCCFLTVCTVLFLNRCERFSINWSSLTIFHLYLVSQRTMVLKWGKYCENGTTASHARTT